MSGKRIELQRRGGKRRGTIVKQHPSQDGRFFVKLDLQKKPVWIYLSIEKFILLPCPGNIHYLPEIHET